MGIFQKVSPDYDIDVILYFPSPFVVMSLKSRISPAPPNLLFILSDQHRADILGSCRDDIATPHLDRLAREGTRFDRFFTSSQPCVPSRASMLTGRHAELHRTISNQEMLPPVETTWPEVLEQHGYQALAVGRTHHIDKGFETVRVPYGNSFPMIDYANVHEIPWGPKGFIEPSPVPFEDFYEKRVADTAADLLEDMGRNQPFAMYVGFITPHPPFVLPEPYFSMYDPAAMRIDSQAPAPAGSRIEATVRRHYGEHLSEQKQRELQAAYYGMVSMLDACIGVILDRLDALGLSENTLVIYTSDHGEQMGHRGLWNKGTGFDAAARVPFIARQPGVVPADRTTDAMVEMIDLFPTLLETLGLPASALPAGRSGRSFHSTLTGDSDTHRDWIYSSLPPAGKIYRDHRWKLWYERCRDGDHITELYDLENDPEEQHNLFHDPAHAEIRQQLLAKLADFTLAELQEGVSVLYPEARQAATFNGQFRG